ncbi:MAG: carbon-nitrogen hydrolase family protein [Bacteroidota bacterium]
MKIALASPTVAHSIEDGLRHVHDLMSAASRQDVQLICFPEAYLPGLRGLDFEVPDFDQAAHDRAYDQVRNWAKVFQLATIMGMERLTPRGNQIVAYVFDATGAPLGFQAKTQLDPSEEANYVPGMQRHLFETGGLKFGIAICHEGWRYPETVRWAARKGAHIVFHPQHTGSLQQGVQLTTWGAAEAPYYEKAMLMRSIENTIYFASVNYALPFQESATSLIDPAGKCVAHLPYGTAGILVQNLDLEAATGHLAHRFAPERY